MQLLAAGTRAAWHHLADLASVQIGMLDGLYIGSDTLTGDYATVLYRIQLLGFNAIRIPFSFQVSSMQPCEAGATGRQHDLR